MRASANGARIRVSAYNAQYDAESVTVHYQFHPLFGKEVEVIRRDPDGLLVEDGGDMRWVPRWMTLADRCACSVVENPVVPVSVLRDLQQLVDVIVLGDENAYTHTATPIPDSTKPDTSSRRPGELEDNAAPGSKRPRRFPDGGSAVGSDKHRK